MKAVMVTFMAIILVFSSILIISILEPYNISQILFEVTSAFGTVGLSLGITSELTVTSKVILMILMFIGRVGVITFLFLFKKHKPRGKYRYPKEDRKSTRLNSSHVAISYAVFCLKKKNK